ncbi:hypothetical protein LP419_05745 [Massilia sp. H-1]|nr:hypothetical protein LP419_05745 [Massilia sp. H-1]
MIALLLVGVLALAWPWLVSALFAWKLRGQPAPGALPMPVIGLTQRSLSDTWQASRPARPGATKASTFSPNSARRSCPRPTAS